MSVTGIFYIPSNPELPTTATRTVIDRFKAAHQPVRAGRWALEYKLMRDTTSCLPAVNFPNNKVPTPRYMHFLSLSHHQTHGFIRISPRPEVDPLDPSISTQGELSAQLAKTPPQGPDEGHAMKMITLEPQAFLSLFSMTVKFCQPLWNLRHTVVITAGEAYEVGDFRVRIGEVRQTTPRPRLRGAVVEIEYRGPGEKQPGEADLAELESEEGGPWMAPFTNQANREVELATDEDWEVGVMLIREMWDSFSIPGASESIQVPGLGMERRRYFEAAEADGKGQSVRKKASITGVDLARQYIEVFKFYR